jgi:hypothetical protein
MITGAAPFLFFIVVIVATAAVVVVLMDLQSSHIIIGERSKFVVGNHFSLRYLTGTCS